MCQDCVIMDDPEPCQCKCERWELADDNDYNVWEYCTFCGHNKFDPADVIQVCDIGKVK